MWCIGYSLKHNCASQKRPLYYLPFLCYVLLSNYNLSMKYWLVSLRLIKDFHFQEPPLKWLSER